MECTTKAETKIARISYLFIAGTLLVAGLLHLTTPWLTALFGYFALTKLSFLKNRGKWAAVGLFLFLVAVIAYSLGHFINRTVQALPEIANRAIPSVIGWGKHYQIELPFTDWDSFREVSFDLVKSQVNYLGGIAKVARGATTQFVFWVAGCVIAISVFLHPRIELERGPAAGPPSNLYSFLCAAIEQRFAVFYQSFATVMGAQLVISAINTVFTAIFVAAVHLPYPVVVIGVTFLCGLVPVVGNLMSNTIIVGIGFTVSPRMALAALVFLVLIHKLEYFLNSKIIGRRIRNPVWLTLLALILGERLMGVPGLILAPVVLNYIRLELSRIEVRPVAAGLRPAVEPGILPGGDNTPT